MRVPGQTTNRPAPNKRPLAPAGAAANGVQHVGGGGGQVASAPKARRATVKFSGMTNEDVRARVIRDATGSREVLLADARRQLGDARFVSAFEQTLAALEKGVRNRTLTREQAEAIAYEVFERFAGESWYHVGGNKDLPSDALVKAFTRSKLSKPVRDRDTDGDGKLDIVEKTRLRADPEKHDRIRFGNPKLSDKRKATLVATLRDPRIPDAKKGGPTHQTWLGDRGNRFARVGRRNDGYVQFTPTKEGPFRVPGDLRLDGRTVRTKHARGTDSSKRTMYVDMIHVKRKGGQELIGVPGRRGRIDWFEKAGGTLDANGRFLRVDGQLWEPLDSSSRGDLQDLAEAYGAAYATVSSGEARLSPADHNARAEGVNKGRAAETRRAVAALDAEVGRITSKHQATLREAELDVVDSMKFVQGDFAWVAGAMRKGYVAAEEVDGRVVLTLQRGKLDGEEWSKVQRRFSGPLKTLEAELNETTNRLAEKRVEHEKAARSYLKYAKSSAFRSHLESLPMDQQVAKLAELATAIQGTPAAKELANTLLDATRSNKPVTDELAKVVVEAGKSQDPAVKQALGELAARVSLDATLYTRADRTAFAFELISGSTPTKAERSFIEKLVDVDNEQDFWNMARDAKPMAGGRVLGAFAATAKNAGRLGSAQKWMVGGTVMAGFQTLMSLRAAISDPSWSNLAGLALDAGKTATFGGAWAAIAKGDKAGRVTKALGRAGPALAAVSVMADLSSANNASSSEARNAAYGRAAGGTLIGAAGVLGMTSLAVYAAPVAIIGFGIQMVSDLWGPSDRFEDMHKELQVLRDIYDE